MRKWFGLRAMTVLAALASLPSAAAPVAAATSKPAPAPTSATLVPAAPALARPAVNAGPAGSAVTIKGGNFGTGSVSVTFGGVAAQVTMPHGVAVLQAIAPPGPSSSANHSGVVDVAVTVGGYSATSVGGYTYGPAITSPTTGSPAIMDANGNITITGSNLGSASSTVTLVAPGSPAFLGVQAQFVSQTTKNMTFLVSDTSACSSPTGLADLIFSNGAYQVTIPKGFTCGPTLAPGILAGTAGANLTIKGGNFNAGSTTPATCDLVSCPGVTLSDTSSGGADFVQLTPTSASNTSVVVPLPSPLPGWIPSSGLVDVSIQDGSFTWTATFPKALTFGPVVQKPSTTSPATGLPNGLLNLRGLNFGPTAAVTAGGTTAAVVMTQPHNAMTVTVRVPSPAPPSTPSSGLVDLSVNNGLYSTTVPAAFSYGPVIRSVSPAAARPNKRIVIAGANFGPATSTVTVKIGSGSNSLTLPPIRHSNSSIVVLLPAVPAWTPSSGRLDVTVSTGAYTSTLPGGLDFGPLITAIK